MLLMLCMAILWVTRGDGQTPDPATPASQARAESISPEKAKKLNEAMRQAAIEYQAARFENAERWYTSALQLEPGRKDIVQLLDGAHRMLEDQRKIRLDLPLEPRQREKFLKTSYEKAVQYYKGEQYDQAANAFKTLWLAAGDYRGKTLQYYEEAQNRRTHAAKSLAAPAALKLEAPAPSQPEPPPPAAAPPVVAVTQAAAGAPSVPDDEPAAAAPPPDKADLPPPPSAVDAAAPTQAPPDAGEQGPAKAGADKGGVNDLTRLRVTRLLHGAGVLQTEGKLEEARKNVVEALELWPDNAEAKALLEGLNQRLGYSRRDQVNTFMSEGDALLGEKQYDQAVLRYREVLKLDPQNQAATNRIERAEKARGGARKVTEVKERLEESHAVDVLHAQAVKAYDKGDLKRAREIYQQILEQDPGNKLAQTWLEMTKADFARIQADQAQREQAEKRSDEAEKLLNAPISISTDRKIPLTEFMNNLSFTTPVELEYNIAQGADAMIFANFVHKPLREVLDAVLNDIGLSWSIDNKNVITIKSKLISRTYSLSPAQMAKVRALWDSGQLQKNIWNQSEAPAKGVDITLDERHNMLIVTGSQLHIQRIESLLPSLQAAEKAELETRIYKIRKDDGPKIKALIKSIIQSSSNTQFDLERKVFTEGEDMIIRDTPENITKIEELLSDKKFIQSLRDEKLDLQNFSLVPRDIENVKTDQVEAFTARVVEAIEVFLYSQEGKSQAEKEGRHLWFDKATMQLSIVDTPTNLSRVSQYIQALPELGQKSRTEVIFLKYAVAEALTSSLQRILQLTSGGTSKGGANGEETVLQLGRGDERPFHNMRLRVMRVDQTDLQDRNSGSVELQINTGTQVQTLTLRKYDTQYIEDYEFTAEDVQGSTGRPGEGRARIRVRYVPGARTQQTTLSPEEILQQQATAPGADTSNTINPFSDLNAIIVRYTDPAFYQDVINLVKQLDTPVKQVQIETKFVEVNETRAKEFSADFNIAGLGSGRNIDWSQQLVNSSFAQDQSEYRSPFDAPLEALDNANLIKGTTVLNAVIGNFPQLQYSLNLLEAEGILNVVNGPKVLAMDGKQAEFLIEEYTPQRLTTQISNPLQNVVNPLDQAFQNMQLDNFIGTTNNTNLITAVYLRMTPEITSENSIILNDLRAELIDFEGWLASVVQPVVQNAVQTAVAGTPATFSTLTPPVAITNQNAQMTLKRKELNTQARITNGGTIVIGGWTGERTEELTSGVPVLRNMPYLGKLLFSRAQRSSDRTTLLIFLTGYLID